MLNLGIGYKHNGIIQPRETSDFLFNVCLHLINLKNNNWAKIQDDYVGQTKFDVNKFF